MNVRQLGTILRYLVEMEDSNSVAPESQSVGWSNSGHGNRWLGTVKACIWICIGVASVFAIARLTATVTF